MEEYCEHYLKETHNSRYLGKDTLVCEFKKCPYNNSFNLVWEGECSLTLCVSNGFKNVVLENNFFKFSKLEDSLTV